MMRYTEKFAGSAQGILHAAPEFAVSAEDMKISAACRAQNGTVPDRLTVCVAGGGEYELLPADSLDLDRISFEVYSGTIPASELRARKISYVFRIGQGGERSAEYTVALLDADAFPEQPPLRLSEIYARPKGRGLGAYLEVMNPSATETDLFGYEFLIFDGATAPGGEPDCRLPMADAPGTAVLHPGEYAAVWGLTEKNTDKKGRVWEAPEDFFEDFNSEFTNRGAEYSPEDGRVIPVHWYRTDEATGRKIPLEGVKEIPVKHRPSFLCIVPRGKGEESAVYSAVYSTEFGSWDTPVKRSSYWTADVRKPSVGVNICHYAPATPGFPGIGQSMPDVRAALPVLLPVFPDSAVYIGDGDCDLSFAAVPTEKGARAADAWVTVADGEMELRIPAQEKDDGLFHARIPRTVVSRQNKLTYRLFATDGTRTVALPAAPVPVFDNEGPFLTEILPTDGYAYDGRTSCTVRAAWYDISGTDLAASFLKIDGKNVSSETVWTKNSLEYTAEMKPGKHAMFLVLADGLGNITEKRVRFTVSDMRKLHIYRGQVHCHTADSDGTGLPCDAYAYARDIGEADFFAVTDHSHYIDDNKYAELIRAADAFDDPGRFAALWGWEMTWNAGCGYWGHINVLNTRDFVQNMNNMTQPQLFDWLSRRPEAVGMFNHPGYRWGNFDEYAHRTETADRAMCLAEIRTPYYDFEYAHMLSKGWHASPVSNEDNHGADWTTATPSDGYVLAPALTRQNVLDAFREHRTYTASDKTMRLYYKVNGAWLGSHLDNPDKLRFDIRITTENPNGIGLLEIVAEDDIVVAARNADGIRELEWKPVLPPEYDYYYVRITGGDRYCVTAPVWLENRGAPQIGPVRYNASMEGPDTAAVTVKVHNPTENSMRDVRVSFFLSPQTRLKPAETEPFRTVCCGRLKGGSAVNVSAALPELPGLHRVTALVSAVTRSGKRTAVSAILLSPVRITALMPYSTAVEKDEATVRNPFPYITLFNASPEEISLKGARLCAWTVLGKDPQEDRVMSFPAMTVPPRSALTVWVRPAGSNLTASDFNARYGTALREDETLLITEVPLLSDTKDGRRIDLRFGDEVISRAHWNYGLEYTGTAQPDTEHRYVYLPNQTGTVTPIRFSKPEPGAVEEAQRGGQKHVVAGRKDKRRAAIAAKTDEISEIRRQNAVLTKKEGVAAAAGAAAIGAGIIGGLAVLVNKIKKNK